MRSRSVFQKRKHCDFGFSGATKPFQTHDILECLHRFAVSKKIMSASFFVNLNCRLTMFGGETSYLLKASSSLADDCYGEEAVCVKVHRYAKLWDVT